MSASFWLNDNNYPIKAGTITLQGTSQSGNLVAPIVTNSSIVCANLHAEFADVCTGSVSTANVAKALKTATGIVTVDKAVAPVAGQILTATSSVIAQWSAPQNLSNITNGNAFTITNLPVTDYVLKAIDGNTVSWQVDTGGGSGNITSNVLEITNDPQSGWVLTGVSGNTAQWTVAAASGNITSNVLTITNDPQNGYVLTGITGNTATWQAASSGGGGNLTANMITGDSTATAGTTTVLTETSNVVQVFTGSSAQTCQLPATTQLGLMYMIVNKSSGQLIVSNIGGANVDVYTTTGSGTYIAIATANVVSDWLKISSGSG